MTLYYNTVRQNAKNAKYPNKLVIFNTEDLKKAVAYDHVCAEYKDNYRKKFLFKALTWKKNLHTILNGIHIYGDRFKLNIWKIQKDIC